MALAVSLSGCRQHFWLSGHREPLSGGTPGQEPVGGCTLPAARACFCSLRSIALSRAPFRAAGRPREPGTVGGAAIHPPSPTARLLPLRTGSGRCPPRAGAVSSRSPREPPHGQRPPDGPAARSRSADGARGGCAQRKAEGAGRLAASSAPCGIAHRGSPERLRLSHESNRRGAGGGGEVNSREADAPSPPPLGSDSPIDVERGSAGARAESLGRLCPRLPTGLCSLLLRPPLSVSGRAARRVLREAPRLASAYVCAWMQKGKNKTRRGLSLQLPPAVPAAGRSAAEPGHRETAAAEPRRWASSSPRAGARSSASQRRRSCCCCRCRSEQLRSAQRGAAGSVARLRHSRCAAGRAGGRAGRKEAERRSPAGAGEGKRC